MNIEFIPTNILPKEVIPIPVPAISVLPDWFKVMEPNITDSTTHLTGNSDLNLTIKKCLPFRDALGLGYVFTLGMDLEVTLEPNGFPEIRWRQSNYTSVGTHPIDQLPGIKIGEEFAPIAFKWMNEVVVKTPKGTSLLVTHPLNRTELPFYTLSGVVETDSHDIPINFPFFLKKGFTGVLERGTPIAQVFPFKRDDWESKCLNPKDISVNNALHTFIFSRYKKEFWKRKRFK
jgi:hypothetical protein